MCKSFRLCLHGTCPPTWSEERRRSTRTGVSCPNLNVIPDAFQHVRNPNVIRHVTNPNVIRVIPALFGIDQYVHVTRQSTRTGPNAYCTAANVGNNVPCKVNSYAWKVACRSKKIGALESPESHFPTN